MWNVWQIRDMCTGKCERNRALGRHKCRRENKMGFKEIIQDSMDSINMFHDRDKLQTFESSHGPSGSVTHWDFLTS
jgi:hypothetical protein